MGTQQLATHTEVSCRGRLLGLLGGLGGPEGLTGPGKDRLLPPEDEEPREEQEADDPSSIYLGLFPSWSLF